MERDLMLRLSIGSIRAKLIEKCISETVDTG